MTFVCLIIPLILLVVATIYDLRTREIPDWISIGLIVVAGVAALFGWANISWFTMLSGLGLGIVVGLALFRYAELGGGDAKLIAGVGAVLGPVGILIALFWMAIVGGLLALVASVRGQSDYAYAPAIAVGFAAYLIYPGRLFSMLGAT